ncbi:hypothetical protein MNBD_GAMMA13-667 [hydrothermal vent metagenome]|uniref:Uncharacterized protein n=1 Tax=hydrothermal vent metagenome TaxID=652676 RepID=A0A3B0Z948_9ZZZZ
MKPQYDLSQAHLCSQAADELIGYLYLLIEELQLNYCEQELTAMLNEPIPDEECDKFDDDISF